MVLHAWVDELILYLFTGLARNQKRLGFWKTSCAKLSVCISRVGLHRGLHTGIYDQIRDCNEGKALDEGVKCLLKFTTTLTTKDLGQLLIVVVLANLGSPYHCHGSY